MCEAPLRSSIPSATRPTWCLLVCAALCPNALGCHDEGSIIGDVTWGAEGYVAVGMDYAASTSGSAFTLQSNDGRSWERVELPDGFDVACVAFGNGIYVASGPSGVALRSIDGRTWSSRSIANGMDELVFGNGLFVGIGHRWDASSDRFVHFAGVSPDGFDWSFGPLPSDTTGAPPNGIDFANGSFVVYGPDAVRHSSDGVTWQVAQTDLNEVYAYYFRADVGLHYAIGSVPDPARSCCRLPRVSKSRDLVTWGLSPAGDFGYTQETRVFLGEYFSSGWQGVYSFDPTRPWSPILLESTRGRTHGIATSGAELVLVANDEVVVSGDGSNWTHVPLPDPPP